MDIKIKLLGLIFAFLFSASLHAWSTELIRDVPSESDHEVLVAETISKGKKTILVSLSFENKVCITDIVMFDGPNDDLFIKWKSGTILEVKISGDVKI
ncbi:MAG TPA: hypothetical protein ENJ60_03045 [Aeromonadales bacterium]|nr:hypothetical protein [Aeromonadales bacterium]